MEQQFVKSFDRLMIKEVEGKPRTFKGTASTSNPDRVNDVLLPSGASFNLPMPLLMHHDKKSPVGHVTSVAITDTSIEVEFTIPEIEEDGELKKEIDKAYQSLKYNLVKGMSVGFLPDWDAVEYRDQGGLLIKKWDWYELSLVTIPCNKDGEVKKSFDEYQKLAKKDCKTDTDKSKSKKLILPKTGIKTGIKL